MEKPSARAYGSFSDEKLVGILLGFIVPDLMTGELQGVEYFWGMVPEHRDGTNSRDLLFMFEDDCKEAGCSTILCGLSEQIAPEKMRKIYDDLEYRPHTASFVRKT